MLKESTSFALLVALSADSFSSEKNPGYQKGTRKRDKLEINFSINEFFEIKKVLLNCCLMSRDFPKLSSSLSERPERDHTRKF